MAKRSGSPWEPTDIEDLRRLAAERRPIRDICSHLGRTIRAIEVRATRERISLHAPPMVRATARAGPTHQLTPGQWFILTRIWSENRPLRIVRGTSATLAVRFSADGEWGISSRARGVNSLVRLDYITTVGADRYALTELGRSVITKSRMRLQVLPRRGTDVSTDPAAVQMGRPTDRRFQYD